jgi:hypothetical protein
MIIKLYDNEDYNYPLIEIDEKNYELFTKLLQEYQKEETYNIDDFIEILKDKSFVVRVIYIDKEVFF